MSILYANGQNTFEFCYENPSTDDLMRNVIVDKYDNYIITASFFDHTVSSQVPVYTFFLKLDKNGDTILTKRIPFANYGRMEIVASDSTGYIGIGFNYLDTCNKVDLIFNRLDLDFNILWSKKYFTDRYFIWNINSYIDKEKNIIVGGDAYIDSNIYNYSNNVFVYKFKPNGDTLNSMYFSDTAHYVFYDIISNKKTPGYLIFTSGYSSQTNTVCQITTLDTILNIQSVDSVPRHYRGTLDSKHINDSCFLLGGSRFYSGNNEDDLRLTSLKYSDFSIMNNANLGKTDTTDYAAWCTNLDFINSNNIYFGGTSNLSGSSFSTNKSWFFLNNLDSTLNLNWQKFYGGDAYYVMFNLIATEDGGCLMAGYRYDHTIQGYERDIFILKVDSNGEFVSMNENSEIEVKEIIVYPNPGTNELIIRTALNDNIVFELFDSNGSLIKKSKIHSNLTTINTSSLSPGIYFYKFYNNQQVLDAGKWVKQ